MVSLGAGAAAAQNPVKQLSLPPPHGLSSSLRPAGGIQTTPLPLLMLLFDISFGIIQVAEMGGPQSAGARPFTLVPEWKARKGQGLWWRLLTGDMLAVI